MKYFYFLLIFLLNSQLLAQGVSEKFTIYDYLSLTRISDPQFSPDSKRIACVIAEKERWDKTRIRNIWLIASDGSARMQLTNSDKADWNPRWSPDGSKIAFLSSRSEKTQVYLINIHGGEARRITWEEEGVTQFEWIDNSRIAIVGKAPRDSLIVAREDSTDGGYVVGTERRKSALWIQPIDNKSEKTKVTDGNYFIVDMASSSEGNYFALITSPDSDLFNQWVLSEVLVIDKDGNRIFEFKDAKVFNNIDFSPDNKRVSFAGSTVGYSSNNGLFVFDINSSTIQNLTEEFDPTIQSVEWLDNKNLTFSTPRNVSTGIYQISLEGKIDTLLDPSWVMSTYSINSKTKRIAFVASKSQIPSELFIHKFKDNPEMASPLTDLNNRVRNKKLAFSEVIRYPSFDGEIIEAVVTYPPDYSVEENYPLMVYPHGGPDGIIMDGFSLSSQIFAQEGIIVFKPNFRGGIGYGSEFYAANRGKLGDIDYKDIMAGLEFLIDYASVDTSKLVVGGWSYGGYMTNWIIGHTNRFKAAVSVAGIANTVSMYAQSDINHGEIAIWEFMSVPVLNVENFIQSSPLHFLRNCTTPTLLLHGEADKRVPAAQAWEIYRALVDLGVEVEMVLYPDASHGIEAPKQFADVFNRWVEWYNRFLESE